MKRPLRPRATAAIAVTPACVTDLTAHVVIGFEARQFREFVRDQHVRHAVYGQRVVARVADVLDAIDRLATSGLNEAPGAEALDEGEPTADAILARIGRVRGGR